MLSEHGTQSKPDLPEDGMDYSTDRQIWTALATAHHPMTGESGWSTFRDSRSEIPHER
jgi:hypothetical protein